MPDVRDESLIEGGRQAIVSDEGVVVWWEVALCKRAQFAEQFKKSPELFEQWCRMHFGKHFAAAWKIIQEKDNG